jgi:hypothetical protein
MFEHVSDTELRTCLRKFLDRIENYSSEDDCWIWKAARNWQGYGYFRFGGRMWAAHRWSYWLKYGSLTPSLELDHLCKNKSCVNPLHLEEVDKPTNALRGDLFNRNKTHCKRGHEFTEANTYYYQKGAGSMRTCKACIKLRKERKDL